MALKKSQLYSSLWQSCDELRGGMDASQYKDYILTLLFMKYVSDKYSGDPDAIIEVPEGGSFADMVRLKGDKEIGDKINKIIGRLAEANDLKGVGIGPETRQDQTIYDPTHGSGSLLLKGADEAPRGLTIYGQEMDNATWALARMNMILHGHPTADLWRGNTLAAPYFKNPDGSLKTFDFALANPPFSSKAWTSGFNPDADEFRRFEYGVPPAKNGDYAFLLHVNASLKSKGKAAVIMPHGVLFRGNKEADIRKNLVTRGLIKGIIGLPANLFYGTGIPACIVVIEKENAHVRTGIFMIDASKEYMKDGNKNRLQSQYWDVFPSVRKTLFKRGDRAGYSLARMEAARVKATILAHDEYAVYQQRVAGIFDQWRSAHTKRLRGLKVDDKPKRVIHTLSEDLLARFANLPLLSRYDVYQRLMDYWADAMQDDVYLIAADGWLEAAKPRGVIDDREKKIREMPDLVVNKKKYKMDLIPPVLIVARYFQAEQAAIDALQAKQDAATQALEEFTEEHAVEEGLLEEALNDKGKVTRAGVNERLKQLRVESGELRVGDDDAEERAALQRCMELMDAEADAKKAVKDAQEKLDAKVLKEYGSLSEAEIKSLAVDDKWFAAIRTAIEGEVQRITQRLVERVETLSARVDEHLKRMGIV